MTAAVAAEALRLAVGESCSELRPIASGRSSSAWAASSASGDWIARVPMAHSGRPLTYRSEARIGELLHAAGHPVATWSLVEVDRTLCSVGPLLHGRPVEYGDAFQPDLAAALGRLLFDMHHLPAQGFGPLVDDERTLRGHSSSPRAGIVDRWYHAAIWPFDDSDLSGHAVSAIAPSLVEVIEPLRSRIIAESEGPVGVVHSDLHREHILRDEAGRLAGVLDFGDAFLGSCAWDFALLRWYYGDENAGRVAAGYPDAADSQRAAAYLVVAVGLYKLAKVPRDPAVPTRLRRVVEAVG